MAGRRSEPQYENLADNDIDWNCILSKLFHLLMPISNYLMNPFRTAIIPYIGKNYLNLDLFIFNHKS